MKRAKKMKKSDSSSLCGIGNDIIEIERIRECYEKHGERFLERIFTEKEKRYCLKHQDPVPHLAARFSAKEAVVKALGVGFGEHASWKEIEILNDKMGKPEVFLFPRLKEEFSDPKILISISHCKLYVTTVAIFLSN
jgi:holo-[acyl-carrier protein] synthase